MVDELIKVPGIGETLAKKLISRKITNKDQLYAIIDELPKEARINLHYGITKQIPLKTAKIIATELKSRILFGEYSINSIITVGSIRREVSKVKDIDLLVVVPDKYTNDDTKNLLSSVNIKRNSTIELMDFYKSGVNKRSFIIKYKNKQSIRPKYYSVDMFITNEKEKPFALYHYTGSKLYNIRIRAYAKRLGYTVNQHGIFCGNKRAPKTKNIKSEKDITNFLNVTYRLPNDRNR